MSHHHYKNNRELYRMYMVGFLTHCGLHIGAVSSGSTKNLGGSSEVAKSRAGGMTTKTRCQVLECDLRCGWPTLSFDDFSCFLRESFFKVLKPPPPAPTLKHRRARSSLKN